MAERPPVDPALRIVIGYKLVRAACSLALAAVLVFAVLSGRATELARVVDAARAHGMTAWIAMLVHPIGPSSPNTLWLLAAAIIAADGALSVFEGWALARGVWWGPWVVVVLTGAFVPGEIIALARHASPARAALLVVNLAVALFLFARARRPVPVRLL